MDWFIWWGTHAPMWQLYLAMTVAVLLLILLLSSMIVGATKCGEEKPAMPPSESVRIAVVDREATLNRGFVAKNANVGVTQKQSDRTLQDVSGTKIGYSAKATSAASVIKQF